MQINNNWITGFVDGDGCFSMQKVQGKYEIHIRYTFIVTQDKRSVDVLHALKERFKCGNVHRSGGNMYEFAVTDRKSLINIIIPFFIKYPLQSEKRKDFYKFAEGLNNFMKKPVYDNFYEIQIKNFKVGLNDQWVAGFIDAEGCFNVSVAKRKVQARFSIGLASRDHDLMHCLQQYLQCGNILIRKGGFIIYTVSRLSHLIDIILRKFFSKTAKDFFFKTSKRESFKNFKKVVFLLKDKKHLTEAGMQEIKTLKSSMNIRISVKKVL